FAIRLAGLCIAYIGVERVMVVGHLPASVGALRPAQEGSLRSGPRAGLAGYDQRRPVGRAGAVAPALATLIFIEEVQRAPATARADKDAAEVRVPDCNSCRPALRMTGMANLGQRGRH